jgi:hypothetical protein
MEGQRYLDETSIQTLMYLESRLLRIEHILYGHTTPPAKVPAIPNLQQLEHRFAQLLQRVRTYAELLKICTSSRSHHKPGDETGARVPHTHTHKHRIHTCLETKHTKTTQAP